MNREKVVRIFNDVYIVVAGCENALAVLAGVVLVRG